MLAAKHVNVSANLEFSLKGAQLQNDSLNLSK